MIDKNKIKEMANHILHPQKSKDTDRNIMHVEREWFFGVVIGVVVVVVGAIWSWSSYQDYRSVDTLESVGAGDAFIYREELVKEVLKDFEQREERYETLLKEALDNRSEISVATSSSEIEFAGVGEEGEAGDLEIGNTNPTINNNQSQNEEDEEVLNFD